MSTTKSLTEIRDEMAIEHNESLQYFNNSSFDQCFKNGFDKCREILEGYQGFYTQWLDHGCESYSKPCPICAAEDVIKSRTTIAEILALLGSKEIE